MNKTKTFGFTLVEILVVATIVALLAAGGVVSYSQFGKQSRDARRKADIEQVRAALEMYKSNNVSSSYPTAALGLDTLVTGTIKYLNAIPLDPKTNATYITYTPLPNGCNGSTTVCTNYTLTGALDNGDIYQTDPLGGTTVTATPTPP